MWASLRLVIFKKPKFSGMLKSIGSITMGHVRDDFIWLQLPNKYTLFSICSFKFVNLPKFCFKALIFTKKQRILVVLVNWRHRAIILGTCFIIIPFYYYPG